MVNGGKIVKEREMNIEVLRIMSALFVIIVHVCAPYIKEGSQVMGSSVFALSSTIQIFTRIAVPVFVLISGRYLLDSWDEKDLKGFYKKRYGRIIIPFLFALVLYGFYRILWVHDADFGSYMKDVIIGQPYGHLWYFYMLIGLYAVTPVLYKIKNRLSHKAFRNLGLILLITAMFTQIGEEITGFKFPVLYFIDYVGFFITGYTLKNYRSKFNKYVLLFIYLLLCVVGSGIAIFLQAKGIMFWMILHMGNNIIATPAAIFLYLFFGCITMKKNAAAGLGKYALGIYIVHNMFVTAAMNATNNSLTLIALVDIILYWLIASVLSFVIVRILWNFDITRKLVK